MLMAVAMGRYSEFPKDYIKVSLRIWKLIEEKEKTISDSVFTKKKRSWLLL